MAKFLFIITGGWYFYCKGYSVKNDGGVSYFENKAQIGHKTQGNVVRIDVVNNESESPLEWISKNVTFMQLPKGLATSPGKDILTADLRLVLKIVSPLSVPGSGGVLKCPGTK